MKTASYLTHRKSLKICQNQTRHHLSSNHQHVGLFFLRISVLSKPMDCTPFILTKAVKKPTQGRLFSIINFLVPLKTRTSLVLGDFGLEEVFLLAHIGLFIEPGQGGFSTGERFFKAQLFGTTVRGVTELAVMHFF